MMASSVIVVVYSFHIQPFSDNKQNYLDIFNEATILLMSYANIPYSDYTLDPELKFKIGWIMVASMLLNLALNILFIMILSLLKIFIKFKKKFCLKKEKPAIKHKSDNFDLTRENILKSEGIETGLSTSGMIKKKKEKGYLNK